MSFLYLIINLASISIPIIFSFHKKINFISKIKAVVVSLLITSIPFIIWDEYFTRIGVWGFNSRYVSGLYIYNLPIEEIMFFICIPYSCLFTYFVIKKHLKIKLNVNWITTLYFITAFSLIILAFFNQDKLYTFYSFTLCGIFIFLCLLFLSKHILDFTTSFLILLIPFFIVNGLLTGLAIDEPIVWYNNNENLGIRMFTIPVEDTFYGFMLLQINVIFFEKLDSFYYGKLSI
jgi:lycopene cyclase domain-containing protein